MPRARTCRGILDGSHELATVTWPCHLLRIRARTRVRARPRQVETHTNVTRSRRPCHLRMCSAIVCAMWAAPLVASAEVLPERPRATVATSPPPPPARILAVAAGGDVQAALDAALPGDMITLAAGATFTGNFTLPAKSGPGWIVVRSSAPDASLPPRGTRITPGYAAALPKVVSPNASPAIATEPGAHHYWRSGIEVTVAAGVASNSGLILLGTGIQTALAQVPHDIVLDRVYVHGTATGDLRRTVALNSANTAV